MQSVTHLRCRRGTPRARFVAQEERSFVGGARPSGLWAVPAAVFFFIFGILPLFIVVGLSFFKWNGLGTPQFAGGSTGPSSFMIPKS